MLVAFDEGALADDGHEPRPCVPSTGSPEGQVARGARLQDGIGCQESDPHQHVPERPMVAG